MRSSFRLWTIAAAAVLTASIGVAAEQDPRQGFSPADNHPRDTTTPRETTVAPTAFGGAVAPNARLVALVDAGGAPVRTKAVASISRIGTGTYCIRPVASANIDVTKIVPSVSVEYYYSNPNLVSGFNEMTVQWASRGSACSSGTIAVYTFADKNLDSHYTFSNEVAFSLVVP